MKLAAAFLMLSVVGAQAQQTDAEMRRNVERIVDQGSVYQDHGKTICIGNLIKTSVQHSRWRIANCAFDNKTARIIQSGKGVSHNTEFGQGCSEGSVCQITVVLNPKTGYVTKVYDVLPCADTSRTTGWGLRTRHTGMPV